MTTEKNAAGSEIPERRNRILQAGAITLGLARPRRTEGSILTVGEIAAQHDEASSSKSFRQRNQQRSLAIRSGTVSKNKSVAVGMGGTMQKSAHERVRGDIGKNLRAGFARHACKPISSSFS